MKKKIWGVNVIGKQGVNAENDFAIMANEAGDDVIVKIKDAELTGAEFAVLKEIAEGGPTPGGSDAIKEQDLNAIGFIPTPNTYYQQKSLGPVDPEAHFEEGVIYFYDGSKYNTIDGSGSGGGMPDPTDANDGDVIKVTVIPAEYEADPPIAVDDVIHDLWAKNDVVPDLSLLTYDDHRFDETLGTTVADLFRGTFDTQDGDVPMHLTFTVCAVSFMGINGILMTAGETPEQESPNDVIFYIDGSSESEMPSGWYTGAPLENGYANLMVMPFDEHEHFPDLTITEVKDQDIWGAWIGKQKPFVEVKPAVKTSGWGSPFPEIKKDGQVLTTSAEEYILKAGVNELRIGDKYTRFYFNTDLDTDTADELIRTFIRDGWSGFDFYVYDYKSDNGDPYCGIGGIYADEDSSVAALFAYDAEENITCVYSTNTGTYTFSDIGEQTVTHGWNMDAVDSVTWPAGSFNAIHTPHSDFQSMISAWGRLLTIQEGLYYGDVRDAKAEWKDAIDSLDQLKLDPDGMGSWDGVRDNQNFVVYNSTDDKPHYMSMSDLKEELGTGQIAQKQDQLVSGENIKTINNESILGEGNLSITASLPTYSQHSLSNDGGNQLLFTTSDSDVIDELNASSLLYINIDNLMCAVTSNGNVTWSGLISRNGRFLITTDQGNTYTLKLVINSGYGDGLYVDLLDNNGITVNGLFAGQTLTIQRIL